MKAGKAGISKRDSEASRDSLEEARARRGNSPGKTKGAGSGSAAAR